MGAFRFRAALAAAVLSAVPLRAAPSDAARARLRAWVQDVRAAEIKRYGLRDALGRGMDCAKIIPDPRGGFLAVYHHYADGVPTAYLARSDDLLAWKATRALAARGSQPTLAPDGAGGFVAAWEQEPDNHVRFERYATAADLDAGKAAAVFDAPRSLSACAEGTPSLEAVSPDRVVAGLHYFRNCDVDRQAVGVLSGFRDWSVRVRDTLDAAVERWGVKGNIGDRDGLSFEGFGFQLMEGQYAKGDFGSWRAFLYDGQTGAADSLAIATDRGSRNFANPAWAFVRVNGRQALLTTFFVPAEQAAPGEAGELLAVRYLDASAFLAPARPRAAAFPQASGIDALGRALPRRAFDPEAAIAFPLLLP
jgi:hypothetical protein